MARGLIFFLTAIILLQLVPIAQGQNITPDVDVQCDQPAPIDVYPGATRTTIIYCSIQNSNPYIVKVEMTYEEGVLRLSGPASVTVPANSDTEIQVVVRGELRQLAGSYEVTITHQVTEASGVPVSSITEQESTNIVILIKQFSGLRVGSDVPLVTTGVGNQIVVQFLVYNDGNAKDRFNLEIRTIEDLEGHGWSVVLPMDTVEIDPWAPPEWVKITLIAPPQVSSDNHTFLSNGSHQQMFVLEFKATSEYSLRTEGIANYDVANTRIHLVEEKDSLIPRSLDFPNMMFSVFAIFSAALFINSSRFKPQITYGGHSESS